MLISHPQYYAWLIQSGYIRPQYRGAQPISVIIVTWIYSLISNSIIGP